MQILPIDTRERIKNVDCRLVRSMGSVNVLPLNFIRRWDKYQYPNPKERMNVRTQESGHVEARFHLHPADPIGQHGLRVGMHHAVHAGKPLQDLAVDATFAVPFRHILLDGGRIVDVVFDDVSGGGD